MEDTTNRLTCTVEEAAERLGIGRGLAYRMARAGQIPALRLGYRLVVPLSALEEMLRVPTAGSSGE